MSTDETARNTLTYRIDLSWLMPSKTGRECRTCRNEASRAWRAARRM